MLWTANPILASQPATNPPDPSRDSLLSGIEKEADQEPHSEPKTPTSTKDASPAASRGGDIQVWGTTPSTPRRSRPECERTSVPSPEKKTILESASSNLALRPASSLQEARHDSLHSSHETAAGKEPLSRPEAASVPRRSRAAHQHICGPSPKEKDTLSSASTDLALRPATSLQGPRRDSLFFKHGLGASQKSHSKLEAAASTCDETTATSQAAKVTLPRRTCACLDCRPNLYLDTVHAHELRRFQRSTDRLGLFQHDCLQLAELAIASFDGNAGLSLHRQSDSGKGTKTANVANVARTSVTRFNMPPPGLLSSEQLHAMQNWKHWLANPCAHGWRHSLDLRQFDPNVIFHAPIMVFNQLFFLGQMPLPMVSDTEHGILTIQWSPLGTQRRAHSHTTSSIITTIYINPTHPTHFLNPFELINTLLHELTHGFFQRHSCYSGGGEGCDKNQVCVELCRENYGASGHGRAWQKLAAAIEEAAPRLLSCWPVDLGRAEGAVREVEGMGAGWWPTRCGEALVDGDFSSKLGALMRSRDDDKLVVGKVRSWAMRGPGCPRERQAYSKEESRPDEWRPGSGKRSRRGSI